MNIKLIGKTIKIVREYRNLTQLELAEILNLKGNSVITNLERGLSVPRIDTLCKIAEALDYPLDFIIKSEVKYDILKKSKEMVSEKTGKMVVIEPECEYTREQITQGLQELINDEKTKYMNKITLDEIEWLKTIRFSSTDKPTKYHYVDFLYIYRKIKDAKD